jgi:hypothetical protein
MATGDKTMSWQTPLWTCGRADWVGAYDDVSDGSDGAEPRTADKSDLAAADENPASETPKS